MPKTKTQAQLDRAADLRLQKTYGISLAEYDELLAAGNGGCWICESKPTTRRLHVDHDHSWKKIKIETTKLCGTLSLSGTIWQAWAEYNGRTYCRYYEKKSLAVRAVKELLKRASVRGLLCYPHNAGLQKFSDRPEWLLSAGIYISNFRKGGPLPEREQE